MFTPFLKWLGGGILATILVAVILPHFMGSCACGDVNSTTKASMHSLQLGVERYAGDYNGKYPEGVARETVQELLLNTRFDWAKYVASGPKNPFNKSISGSGNMEPDVRESMPGNVHVNTIAQTYTGKGMPGGMRYFVDSRTHATYAIIGYDKDGNIIKEDKSTHNLVLYNGVSY